jgi:hypothetical protein
MRRRVARRVVEGLGIVFAGGAVGALIAATWPHHSSDEAFRDTAPSFEPGPEDACTTHPSPVLAGR